MQTATRFKKGKWNDEINVRNFIQLNYSPYQGDSTFLEKETESTKKIWEEVRKLTKEEAKNNGTLDIDTKVISTIISHKPGYIDKESEKIVGLQTDAPLKRAVMPYGGIKVVEKACEAYGYELDEQIKTVFNNYRKTHNDGVFDAYTPDMIAARKAGIITGLPDAYGRGRIIGDYRRVPLFGVDRLIEDKIQQKLSLVIDDIRDETIQLKEEIAEQIKSLKELKEMAKSYGYDISKPATNAFEAIQWLYFAYLAATKEQNGAAMSLGRVSTFLDIYIEKDIKEGLITEQEAQELIDHFVIKLRMVRFLRTPEYNELFSGDPTWITECIGGMGLDGRTLVTKTSYRILNTLYNLGAAPEPNLTIMWSERLPKNFKDFSAKVSIDTSSIQYENDDLMREYWGDDYGIACCVSAMKLGKQMQFFGARCNLAKALLYAINGGRDEITGIQVGPKFESITSEYLDYDEVMAKFTSFSNWLAKLYVNTLNVIHYMHDKYAYESLQMALHDRDVKRTMACGIAGLSVCADSFSAIKHAKVKVIRNEKGLAVDFEIEGDYPMYGNNDDAVDKIAIKLVKDFMSALNKNSTYRKSILTQSILTITSNVVYGKKTGNTPDGRKKGEPFAPGANPMHGRDKKGALASLSSVAKLPYNHSLDGISYTFSITPSALGKTEDERVNILTSLLDGYFASEGHHININVFEKETLLDAMDHPEQYPQLTVRVSGYAVNFVKLTREQQIDVVNRTFHSAV